MKKLYIILFAALLAVGASSCRKQEAVTGYYANALVTVKKDATGFFLQLDDSTTLRSAALSTLKLEKEARALCRINPASEKIIPGQENEVILDWLDTIRTKKALASADAIAEDPVEIMNSWTTCVEDGYMTLRFRTIWASNMHIINLVAGTNPENTYELVLSHDNGGDTAGQFGDALVAFDLSVLPPTGGKYVPLTLKWKSFSGDKSAVFKFRSRD